MISLVLFFWCDTGQCADPGLMGKRGAYNSVLASLLPSRYEKDMSAL